MKYFLLLLLTNALTFPMQRDISPLSQRIASLENNQMMHAAREKAIITEIAKLQLNTEELSKKNMSLEQRLQRLSERNQQNPEQPHQQLVALQRQVENLKVDHNYLRIQEESLGDGATKKTAYILIGSATITGIGYMMKLAADSVFSERKKEKNTLEWKLDSYFLGDNPR